MTTRPEIAERIDALPGLAAVALFVVMGVVIVASTFESAAGFDAGAEITRSIGYALFNLKRDGTIVASEGFLMPFLAIAFVLDAALGAAVMLARRDGGEE
ncbi:MAG: proton-conducting membrane transporter [Halodesulfurarchaeum sp.]